MLSLQASKTDWNNYVNLKTEKQTIHSTYLLSVGCGRLAEGKFVFLLYVAWKRGLPQKHLHGLSCFIQLKSVLLISCAFWIFFQNAGSQLWFRFCSYINLNTCISQQEHLSKFHGETRSGILNKTCSCSVVHRFNWLPFTKSTTWISFSLSML